MKRINKYLKYLRSLPINLRLIAYVMPVIFIFGIYTIFLTIGDIKQSRVVYDKWLLKLKAGDEAYIATGDGSRFPKGRILSISGDSVTVVVKTKKENLTLYK